MYLYIIDVYISIYFNKKYNYLTSEIKYLSLKVSSEKLKIKSIFLNDFFMPNLKYHLYFAIFYQPFAFKYALLFMQSNYRKLRFLLNFMPYPIKLVPTSITRFIFSLSVLPTHPIETL